MKKLTSPEDFSEAIIDYVENDKNTLMHVAVMEPNNVSVSATELKKKSVQFVLCDQTIRENILEGLFCLDKMILVRTNKMLDARQNKQNAQDTTRHEVYIVVFRF
jgi:hypothetical protein